MNTASISKTDTALPKVILVFGPTAVGKTQIVSRLFGGLGEVISADSMQAYRGLDIATAKPDESVKSGIPHHLIDIRDPDEQYNAGDFVTRADCLVVEICARKRVPVISGGTPFYLRNFIYGLPPTPPGDPVIRAEISREVEKEGPEHAYRRLLAVDPQTAGRISPRDVYRIKRALEVYRTTGRKLSSFPVSRTRREVFDMLLIGLDRPREELNRLIEQRVEKMFEQGLVTEVASLFAAGYGEGSPGMQGIGYREFLTMRKSGCLTLKEVRELIIRNTRRYAKRQRTFFRRFDGSRWFHPDDIKTIEKSIQSFLA